MSNIMVRLLTQQEVNIYIHRLLNLQIITNPYRARADFGPIYQSAPRGGKTKFSDFFFIGAARNKTVCKIRIFSYGLTQDILSKKSKSKGGRFKGLSLLEGINSF